MWITICNGQYKTGARFEKTPEYFELYPSRVFLMAAGHSMNNLVPPPPPN